MKKVLIVFLVLLALLSGFLWYLSQPKGLGISYSQEDFVSAHQKLGVSFESLSESSNGKTLVVSGAHRVDKVFTSKELTALADTRHLQYGFFPFRNVQIRINADGSVEGSAKIKFSDAVVYLEALGFSSQEIAKGAENLKIPDVALPVYLKVKGEILNNQSTIFVISAQVARIPVSQKLIDQYAPALNDFVEMIIKDRQPSYNVEKLAVEEGNVHFTGTAPEKEQAVKTLVIE